jgi:long-chain acyl-CoA synthetase
LRSPASADCGNTSSVNWQLISHACSSISTTVATAYDTLGEDGLTHSLNEPNCIGLFTNAELLPTLFQILSKAPSVKFVIYDGEPKSSILSDLAKVREGIQVLSITELRDKGKAASNEPLQTRRPKPDTIACIMYTSGTTGAPKGVIITHANVVASVGGLYTSLAHHLSKTDCYLAYLPLAHILEYLAEAAFVFIGMTQGYARVKTLTDASVRNCKGDLVAFRPTIMVGVPAVWETIRKGIIAKVNAGGSVKKSVFNGAMSVKKAGVPGLSQLADSVVLSGVRAATGGRLRLALSGGASLSRETQEFLSVALVTMLQGLYMSIISGISN